MYGKGRGWWGSGWFGMCHWIVWMSCPPCQLSFPLLSLLSVFFRSGFICVCDSCRATRAFLCLYVRIVTLGCGWIVQWLEPCVCVFGGRFYSAWGGSVSSMVVADCFYTTSCYENLQWFSLYFCLSLMLKVIQSSQVSLTYAISIAVWFV